MVAQLGFAGKRLKAAVHLVRLVWLILGSLFAPSEDGSVLHCTRVTHRTKNF